MYIFGRDVLLKIEGYNYRNGEPTDFRDPVTFFVNIVYPNTRPFLNSVRQHIQFMRGISEKLLNEDFPIVIRFVFGFHILQSRGNLNWSQTPFECLVFVF
jgi:hypothetical protein